MPFVTRKSFLLIGVLAGIGVAIVGGFVWSGLYNIGADDQHTRPVYALLETMRERSIQARADDIKVPDLSDSALIRQGAGNYDSMCAGCHLAPGMEDTELSRGLYPVPPAFATAKLGNPAHHFWVIKHGIKASGMPAWGKSMDDQYIWGMVALLQQLPKLDAAQYRALVASSGGHQHGGGETPAHEETGSMAEHDEASTAEPVDESKPHTHAPGTSPHAPADPHAGMDMSGVAAAESKPHEHAPGTPADHHDDAPATPRTKTHTHADGTVESHPVEPAKSDDGHDHEH